MGHGSKSVAGPNPALDADIFDQFRGDYAANQFETLEPIKDLTKLYDGFEDVNPQDVTEPETQGKLIDQYVARLRAYIEAKQAENKDTQLRYVIVFDEVENMSL